MSADRTPQGEFSFFAPCNGRPTRAVVRFPVATVTLGVALACVSIYLSTTRLSFHTSRLDLLNPESDYNRLWIDYINEFGDDDDAVVVVEGASRDQVVPVLQEISQSLSRQERLFHAVLHEVDLAKIRSKGLHYLSPDELMRLDGFLAEVGPILDGNWSLLNLGHMTEGLCACGWRGPPARRTIRPTWPSTPRTSVSARAWSRPCLTVAITSLPGPPCRNPSPRSASCRANTC